MSYYRTLIFNGASHDTRTALVRDVTQTQQAPPPVFTLDDSLSIFLAIADGQGGTDPQSGDAAVQPWLAIGNPGTPPTGGSFWLAVSSATSGTLTSGKRYQIATFVAGDNFTNVGASSNATGVIFTATGTTPTTWTHASTICEITADISGFTTSDIQSALNATQAIGANGVTVSQPSTGLAFLLDWNAAGSRFVSVANGNNLTPDSAALISELRAGNATTNARQMLRLVAQPAALQSAWSPTTVNGVAGWYAVMQFATAGMVELLGNAASVTASLELQTIDGSGYIRTVGQVSCIVRNEVVAPNALAPYSIPSFVTTAQGDVRYVQNRKDVTAFTGGGANALDGIATANAATSTGVLVAIIVSGVCYIYQLDTGADATSSPDVIRPTDFAFSTNEKVWRLRKYNSTGIRWLGAWSNSTTYVENDAVSSGGSSWYAKRGNTNVTPVDGADWGVLAGIGSTGPSGTVSVGITTTGAAGTSATVTNSGTSTAAVLNFTIPRGDTGATGAAGPTWNTTETVLVAQSCSSNDLLYHDYSNARGGGPDKWYPVDLASANYSPRLGIASSSVSIDLLSNLSAYWKLDESAGNPRADSSGNGFALAESGTWTTVSGVISNGAKTTAIVSGYLSVADNAALRLSTSFTLCGWFKTGYFHGSSNGILLKKGSEFELRSEHTGHYQFNAFFSTLSASVTGALPLNQWNFVAIRIDSGFVRVSVNGGSDAMSAYSGTPSTGTEDFVIADKDGIFLTESYFDEIGIWQRVLTDAEIAQLYNAGSGLTHPFVGAAVASTVTTQAVAIASFSSGLTTGSPIYAHQSTAGAVTQTAPLSGQADLLVGFATSATDIYFEPHRQTVEIVRGLAKSSLTTSNNTPANLVSYFGSLTLANNSAKRFRAIISGRDTSNGNTFSAELRGLVKRGANAAATSVVASVKDIEANEDGAFDANASADTTNGALAISVTGHASHSVNWNAQIELVEIA
jgi:hypothetical protein